MRVIWQIERKKHKVFARNPLDTVVAQLKFQPILKIGSGRGVAEYQDLVRGSFPGYGEGELRNIHVGPEGKVSTNIDKVYHFTREEDSCKVQLASDNVMIESKNHKSRDKLVEDFAVVANALEAIYAPVDVTRFGVRYINAISRSEISKTLGKDVTWESLIHSEYLKMPAEITDLEQTFFANQITSAVEMGEITLRYGIYRPQSKGTEPSFHFDIDRYVETKVEFTKIPEILTEFTDDIFSLFNTLPGIDLLEWMSNSGNGENSEELH